MSDASPTRSLVVGGMLSASLGLIVFTCWLILWPIWLAHRQVATLVTAAKQGNFEAEAAAIESLRKIDGGHPGVASLMRAIKSNDLHARRAAALALGLINEETDTAVSTLTALLDEQDEVLRRDAAVALGRLGDVAAPAAPALADLAVNQTGGPAVTTPSGSLARAAAMEALPRIDMGRPAIPQLVKALGNRGCDRACAARLLGVIHQEPETVVSALIELLDAVAEKYVPRSRASSVMMENDDRQIRWAALFSLGEFGADAASAIPTLAKMLKFHDDYGRNTYYSPRPSAYEFLEVRILAQIGPAAVPTLIEILQAKNEDMRADAARALGGIGPAARDAIPAVKEALHNDYSQVRDAASKAIQQIEADPSSQP